jgi:diguanylate cyclase (GGDEF)-like protein
MRNFPPAEGPPPSEPVQTVLVIDDDEDIHALIDVRLKPECVHVLHAADAEAALALARSRSPDLILLDLDLPGKSGLDLCKELRDTLELSAIPVIFLTGTVDVAMKVRAFDAGAMDYVTKPFDAVERRARVRAALRTKRLLDMLATRAKVDGLTGIWNRAFFDARLAEAAASHLRYGRPVSVLIVDVDHFKALNDIAGHPFGDQVLRRVAATVGSQLRSGDVACRYGGEEFGVILHECERGAARTVGERIRERIEQLELVHAGRKMPITASVGYGSSDMLPGQPVTAEALLAIADRGLYVAKRGGRNRVSGGDSVDNKAILDTAIAGLPQPRPERKPLLPGTRMGPYEVLGALGSGAMGTVYRAIDGRLLREVAVKVLTADGFRHDDAWRRFDREARALAALDHPHIVRVFDLGISPEGDPFLVLELLEGTTLRERLGAGALPLDEALRLTMQLTSALAAAHDKGIVHRDLKPENLFVTRDKHLKVLDFGLAKVLGPLVPQRGAMTETGVVLGTVGYLAPEQARGLPVDARSDLFAVGAILYELASGRPAFDGPSPVETLHAILNHEPSALADARLDALVRRLLEKDPEARVGSARELETRVAALAQDLACAAGQGGQTP